MRSDDDGSGEHTSRTPSSRCDVQECAQVIDTVDMVHGGWTTVEVVCTRRRAGVRVRMNSDSMQR